MEDILAAPAFDMAEAVEICDENSEVETDICISDTRKFEDNFLNYNWG